MVKICHLTSVHPPFDIRIFYKECTSLSQNGYKVSLIAPISNPTDKNNVKIIPIKLPKSRLKRILLVTFRMFRLALKQKAKLYHFHDPELMLCGVLLRLSGKKVIYDIHENVRLSFVSKQWLPNWSKPIVKFFYFLLEQICLPFYSHLILAEESYLKYYPQKKSTVVLNYPINTHQYIEPKTLKKPIKFIYVGVVHKQKGLYKMCNFVKLLNQKGIDCSLDLVGEVRPNDENERLKSFIDENKLQKNINVLGEIDFTLLREIINKAHFGFSLLQPIPNYLESLPTKIFEYMQMGVPVITNDFPLYVRYIENSGAGICISYDETQKVDDFIEKCINNPNYYKSLSLNGINFTNKECNWELQQNKLLNVYKKKLD